MALVETKIKDILRGGSNEEIIIRLDFGDIVELDCHCDYDPALRAKGKNENNKVKLMRKIEVQNRDGLWSLYPSVVWQDGVDGEDQLQTFAIVKIGEDKGCSIMCSSYNVPDGTLMVAAAEAGIYTESIC